MPSKYPTEIYSSTIVERGRPVTAGKVATKPKGDSFLQLAHQGLSQPGVPQLQRQEAFEGLFNCQS